MATKRVLRIALVATFLAAIGRGSLNAHHGYSDFLQDQTVSVEGTIERILFGNPHVMLTIKTRDADTYTAEWQNIRQLEITGVTNATLRVGDLVVVSGSPKRNPAEHYLSLLKEVRRPADGWLWARQRPKAGN